VDRGRITEVELSKVERGRIVHIDNIGLVKPGLKHTTGFGMHR
jgi:hypothetical protein